MPRKIRPPCVQRNLPRNVGARSAHWITGSAPGVEEKIAADYRNVAGIGGAEATVANPGQKRRRTTFRTRGLKGRCAARKYRGSSRRSSPALASIAFPAVLPAIPIPNRSPKPLRLGPYSAGRFLAVPKADTKATPVRCAGSTTQVVSRLRL